MALNVHVLQLPIYFSIRVKIGSKIKRNCTFSFQETNSFNNSRKEEKFCIDFVDTMLNTPRTLEMPIVFPSYLIPHENIAIPSEAQILVNDLCMTPL